jgi:hypothetical protein
LCFSAIPVAVQTSTAVTDPSNDRINGSIMNGLLALCIAVRDVITFG